LQYCPDPVLAFSCAAHCAIEKLTAIKTAAATVTPMSLFMSDKFIVVSSGLHFLFWANCGHCGSVEVRQIT
jgi:hypothetical protein